MPNRLATPLAVTVLMFLALPTSAQTIDPNGSIVHLRETCGIDDCFTSTSALTTWLWGGGAGDRSSPPSSTDRVAVHVGPGEFGAFECDGSTVDRGYVSVIGSGRQTTRFVRTSNFGMESGACFGSIRITNCQEMDFSRLAAEGETGILWKGGGEATWTDVDMIARVETPRCSLASLGWYDVVGPGGRSLHYFFGSRAIARDHPFVVNGFDAVAAEVWFYGGDIVAEATNDPTGSTLGVNVANGADVRLFGTTVRTRVLAGGDVAGSGEFGGVIVRGGTFHMHGGIINASASGASTDKDVFGLRADGANAFAHTPGTAFVVQAAGAGVASRLSALNGGAIQSPFVWPAGITPPTAESLHGADAYVDTGAGPSGGEAHLMVRDESCSAGGGPWRDMATGACRP